jgi:hypothetical protein
MNRKGRTCVCLDSLRVSIQFAYPSTI